MADSSLPGAGGGHTADSDENVWDNGEHTITVGKRWLAELEADRDAAQAEVSALRDAVDSFDTAYPESVFPEYGPGELSAAIAAIKEAGVSSERLHATWARHISKSIHQLAGGPE